MPSESTATTGAANGSITDGEVEGNTQQIMINALIVVIVVYLCSTFLFAKKDSKKSASASESSSSSSSSSSSKEKKRNVVAPKEQAEVLKAKPAVGPAAVPAQPAAAPVPEAAPAASSKSAKKAAAEAAAAASKAEKAEKEKEKEKSRANKQMSKSAMAKQLAAEVKMLREQLEATSSSASSSKGADSTSTSGAGAGAREKGQREAASAAGFEAAISSAEWETVSTKSRKPPAASVAATVAAAESAATKPSSGVVGSREAAKPFAGTFMSSSSVGAAADSATAAAAATAVAAAPTVPAAPVAPSCDQVVNVPAKKLGLLIGPKGATLNRIRDACNVLIDIPPAPTAAVGGGEPAMIAVSVTGNSAASVSKAVRAIQDLGTKGYSALTASMSAEGPGAAAGGGDGHDNAFMERTMQVPNRFLPHLIGKGGATIRELQNRTGAKVTVTNNTNFEKDVQFSRLTFAGFKSQVNAAKAIVRDVMRYFHSDELNPELEHMELGHDEVPPEMYNVLIGSKGSEIKHIQGNFRVALHMPQGVQGVECLNNNLVLVGAPENVTAAQRYILKLVASVHARNAERDARAGGSSGGASGRGVAEEDEDLEPWMLQYVKSSRAEASAGSEGAATSGSSASEGGAWGAPASAPSSGVVWDESAAATGPAAEDEEEAEAASSSSAADAPAGAAVRAGAAAGEEESPAPSAPPAAPAAGGNVWKR